MSNLVKHIDAPYVLNVSNEKRITPHISTQSCSTESFSSRHCMDLLYQQDFAISSRMSNEQSASYV